MLSTDALRDTDGRCVVCGDDLGDDVLTGVCGLPHTGDEVRHSLGMVEAPKPIMQERPDGGQLALEQAKQIKRVTTRIGRIVVDFCRQHTGREFHAADLVAYVEDHSDGAPASPDRILRDLRQRGVVSYHVVSRSKSLYRIDSVAT